MSGGLPGYSVVDLPPFVDLNVVLCRSLETLLWHKKVSVDILSVSQQSHRGRRNVTVLSGYTASSQIINNAHDQGHEHCSTEERRF